MNDRIIGAAHWNDWVASPPGRYMLEWEQAQYDAAVADVFGYFAVQCGLPQLECLRSNRMPSRVLARVAGDATDPAIDATPGADTARGADDPPLATVRVGQFEELPFASQSLDLVVLPHVLEFARDPHQVVREVDRVLRPEGRLLVSGLNPVSLWGARQVVLRRVLPPFLPREGQFLAPPRLRDWLQLLGFELERGRYGCYRPPCRTRAWLERTAFMERAGDRWWPICGAVYFVSAVKRVRGMRLIGPAWKVRPASLPAAVASPHRAPVAVEAAAARGGAATSLTGTCSRETAAAD